MQDAAYGSLLRSRRQVLHARIAAALEKQVAEPIGVQPEVVAHHWANAGLPDRAIDHWARAGQHALGRSATSEALAHFNAALVELGKLPASVERDRRELAVQRALGSALVAAHGFAATPTGRAYERALELTERLGELSELFPVLYGLCLYHLYGAELAAANADAQRLIDLAKAGNDQGFLFFAHRAAGVSALPVGRFAEARTHLERALSLYRPKEHRAPAFVYAFDPRVVCLDYLARSLLPLGQVAEALAVSGEALAEARRLGHRNSMCLPLFYGATLQQLLGDRQAVRTLQEELERLAGEERFPIWVAGAKVLGGWVRADEGDLRAGAETITQGIDEWRATGARLMLPYFEALVAETELRGGAPAEAAIRLRAAIEGAEACGELWFAAELHRLLGAALQAGGDSVAACAEFRVAIDLAGRQGAELWQLRASVALAEAMAAAGDEAGAIAIVGQAVADLDCFRNLPEYDRVQRLRANQMSSGPDRLMQAG